MISALIVAAGQGLRMGTAQLKQYLNLSGRPVLVHTLQVFDQCERIDQLVLVVAQSQMAFCEQEVIAGANLKKRVVLIAGGACRQDSVFNGLQWLGAGEGVVLIHDGVRPLVTESLVDACIQGAMRWGACIPVVQAVDTPKQIDDQEIITRTLPREHLRLAQTPQAFRLALIHRAHAQARLRGHKATDDASLAESMGVAVHVIAGLRENIKITTPEDLAIAETLLALRKDRPIYQ